MKYDSKSYGQINIEDPLVIELINSPEMQRLKNIYTNGVYFLFYPGIYVTKFEHSLGVYYLLKKFGASKEEQIAGLLHDVSHKVFAHVMDHYYGSVKSESHQDSIHNEYISGSSIPVILKKYGYDFKTIIDLQAWKLLDNELPNLCADRLDYTLGDSLQVGFSDKKLINEVLNDLKTSDKGFIFNNLSVVKKFGQLSYKMQIEFWHMGYGGYAYDLMADILKYAIEQGFITEQDFWLGDHEMIAKLEA